jgi:hypothetical protein
MDCVHSPSFLSSLTAGFSFGFSMSSYFGFPYEERICEFDIGQVIKFLYLGACPNYVWGQGIWFPTGALSDAPL